MKLLSRFRKGKMGDGADSQVVADSDEEGLLMPTAAESGVGGVEEAVDSQAAVAAVGAATASGSGDSEASAASAEDDDLLEAMVDDAAEGEDDVDDLMAAVQTPPEADEIEPEATEDADAADDDPLAAFKNDEVVSDLADLVEGIEEIAMADLLEQLRDVRGMLPATPAEDEDAA